MQSIRYINPLGLEVYISSAGPEYILESIRGISAVDTTLIVHNPAGLDGALYQGLLLDDREITVNLHIWSRDRCELYQRRVALIQALGSAYSRQGNMGKLWYQNDFGRWWIPAIIKQGPRPSGRRLGNYLPMQVVLYCPDALWRAEDATLDKLAYLSGGFRFPLRIPALGQSRPGTRFGAQGYRATIINAGDAPAPLELTITGPAKRPKIELKGAGLFVAINSELAAGDSLWISTERGHKAAEITRATGVKENAMGYLDPASTWFQLTPGENLLEYTSGNDTTAATVLVRAWSRYGGV